jgi:hypothetical protein
VNFFVVPFIAEHKVLSTPHDTRVADTLSTLYKALYSDIWHRVSLLSKLGLVSSVARILKQQYHGDVTLVPEFTLLEQLGVQALFNPTAEVCVCARA